jgi:hypothetical protein
MQSSTRDCEPSTQPSKTLRKRRPKTSKGDARAEITGESAREDVNGSSTVRHPQEKKDLHAEGREHPRVMPKLEF